MCSVVNTRRSSERIASFSSSAFSLHAHDDPIPVRIGDICHEGSVPKERGAALHDEVSTHLLLPLVALHQLSCDDTKSLDFRLVGVTSKEAVHAEEERERQRVSLQVSAKHGRNLKTREKHVPQKRLDFRHHLHVTRLVQEGGVVLQHQEDLPELERGERVFLRSM